MTVPPVIGLWTYHFSSGGWDRCNGPTGTSDGFEGVFVYKSAAWKNTGVAWGKAVSTWAVCWTNIDGELSVQNVSATDFDLSPYSMTAWFRYNGDGTIDRRNNSSTITNWSHWRLFDNGRDYEIKFDAASPGSVAFSPTTGVWDDLTSPVRNSQLGSVKSGTGFWFSTEEQDVRIREKVTAPAGGNDIGTVTTTLDAEV
jgi:hypothetical protein